MNTSIFVEAGLTDSEAAVYSCLIKNSPIAPPSLAKLIKESRTNTYKLLESLEKLGLAHKDESEKKIKYWAKSPYALIENINRQKSEILLKQEKLKASMPYLEKIYDENNNQPGIRYFPGTEGVIEIYEDMLEKNKPILTMHVNANKSTQYTIDELHEIKNRLAKKNIKRHIFCVDDNYCDLSENDRMPTKESDKIMHITRTWLKKEDYNSPVEWNVYGESVAIISYGLKPTSLIIENDTIANSLREMFHLLQVKIENEPHYKNLPKYHKYTKVPDSIKKTR